MSEAAKSPEGTEKTQHVGRKLYLVPSIFVPQAKTESGTEPDKNITEYAEKVESYWNQAAEHIRGLETRFGKVTKIYHEAIAVGGEEGLKLLEQLNEKTHRLLRRKCQQGAEFVALEDPDLFQEALDWQRCMAVVLSSSVWRKVSSFHQQASHKRYEFMANRIDETLGDNESGLLIIGTDHAVQFPQDIQVFYVAPPALDEIRRLLRERGSGA